MVTNSRVANNLVTKRSPSNLRLASLRLGCTEDTEKRPRTRPAFASLQICPYDLDDVVSGLFRRFRISWHVISDVVFHQLAHEAVDGAASGSQTLQRLGTGLVLVEGPQNALELADDFLGAGDEVDFFARSMRHFACIPYGGMVSRSGTLRQWPFAQ